MRYDFYFFTLFTMVTASRKTTAVLLNLLFLCCSASNSLPAESAKYLRDTLADADKAYKPAEQKAKYLPYDFASLWLKTENMLVVGFIGANCQRLRLKILTARKDAIHPDTYLITGKSKVANNVCAFTGTIVLRHVRERRRLAALDGSVSLAKQEGRLLAEYRFVESEQQASTGVFTGVVRTDWYLDKKNILRYDDLENYSDGYCNNQFVGTWTSYKTQNALRCNWGDYRIPNAGNFDIGAGEFSPDEKLPGTSWLGYLQTGKQQEKAWW